MTVPALRHRIEDLEELVPFLLNELTRGEARMDGEAMRQLTNCHGRAMSLSCEMC